MTITLEDLASLVGRSWTGSRVYDERDVMLYALSVGAQGLRNTTENSEAGALEVLPGFLTVLAEERLGGIVGVVPLDRFVHAAESLRVTRAPATSGSVRIDYAVTGTELRRSGTAVAVTSTISDAEGVIGVIESRVLARHDVPAELVPSAGARSPEPDWSEARRVEVAISDDQALLFRLNGDRNPLHSDPAVAARSGFDRPILHGLCTFGVAARVVGESLGREVADIAGSFAKPVFPGERLVVEILPEPGAAKFRVLNAHGEQVLSRGSASITNPPA